MRAALSAGLLVAADAKDDAVKKDMDAPQGKWQLVSLTRDGKDADVPLRTPCASSRTTACTPLRRDPA